MKCSLIAKGGDLSVGINKHSNNFCCSSVVKPRAKFNIVPTDLHKSRSDNTVVITGSNDVYCNESSKFIKELGRLIYNSPDKKMVVMTIPHRHDLESWSCVN